MDRYLFMSFLLLSCNILSLMFIVSKLGGERGYSYHGHDFPATLPIPDNELPSVIMVVEETVHYPVLGHISDDEWTSLTSSESGYLRLGPENRLFMVSMFHQMHCLRVLNLAFSKAPIATPGHIQHCLNYLRQSALCSADLTLEVGNFEERDFGVDKTAATYVCKDWEAVYRIMDDNRLQWNNDSMQRNNRRGRKLRP